MTGRAAPASTAASDALLLVQGHHVSARIYTRHARVWRVWQSRRGPAPGAVLDALADAGHIWFPPAARVRFAVVALTESGRAACGPVARPTPPALVAANRARHEAVLAGQARVARAVLADVDARDAWREMARLRLVYPSATLTELAAAGSPAMTRDKVSGLLRRMAAHYPVSAAADEGAA